MAQSTKVMSDRDHQQTLRRSYNEANDTLGVDGFLSGDIGRKIIVTTPSTAVEVYSFYENQTTLMYAYTITYTDNTKATLLSAERTA